jgi:hypothetical protein
MPYSKIGSLKFPNCNLSSFISNKPKKKKKGEKKKESELRKERNK